MQIRHGATCEGESSDSLPSVGGDEGGVVLDEIWIEQNPDNISKTRIRVRLSVMLLIIYYHS